jgi:hypothetical protein
MRRRIKSLLSHERRESSRADTRPNSQPGKPLDQDGSALSETSRSSPSFIAQEALPARPLSAAHGTLSSLNATPEPDPDPSLWNRAYIELREEQPKMVNTYETLLSAEIMDITSCALPFFYIWRPYANTRRVMLFRRLALAIRTICHPLLQTNRIHSSSAVQ